jgi:hypothetical protein
MPWRMAKPLMLVLPPGCLLLTYSNRYVGSLAGMKFIPHDARYLCPSILLVALS